jgi:hypothetical protein
MASDTPPSRYQPMRSAYLSLSVTSDKEAERFHAALADGGEIFMPMAETFFAHRFSMLRDKFGANWMIIHQRPMPPQYHRLQSVGFRQRLQAARASQDQLEIHRLKSVLLESALFGACRLLPH